MSFREDTDPVIGQSDAFLAVLEQVSRVAPLSKPVLVVGERGTGKELIAARIHYLSERWQQAFVKFNCAALNEELLESELFGHVAGAYTGAARARVGRFELADGGTIFLDELPSMSVRLQEKLLRVIEYGEFERLGSSQTLRTDVRLIGAANVDLPDMARRGQFREDLLDRLSFDVVTLPPLRARTDDILLLAERFGQNMAQELGHEYFPGFAPAVERELLAYRWPGNVRELRNVVERAVYRNTSPRRPIESIDIDPFESPWRPHRGAATPEPAPEPKSGSVPAATAGSPAIEFPMDFKRHVEAQEIEILKAALAAARFNQRRAAELLSLSYHQLRGMLRKYALLDSRGGQAAE